jgi:hypothetical protein
VHFYNWKQAALCSEFQQLRADPAPESVNVTLGSSDAMLGVILGLAALGIILIVTGVVLQRRFSKKHKKHVKRNRRFQ